MLECLFMSGVEKFIDNDRYVVWKFPANPKAYEKQRRPLIYSYSIMTRAYGTWFNKDNFIGYFNDEGFDVYLVDWGTEALFTLPGWTLDDLAATLEKEVIDPLLELYRVETLNVFGVCLGGFILSYLIIKKQKDVTKKLHRVAYYGVPLIGGRDLGVEKTFRTFYDTCRPWQHCLQHVGISLFLVDMLLLSSSSFSMLKWKWTQFWKENQENSFMKIVMWTYDDRWIPFQALMDILNNVFFPKYKYQHDYHTGYADNIHFLNIVGKDDMLVNPAASIIEWGSPTPSLYKTFRQMIVNTGHFMFARPYYQNVKKEIARWFSGYTFSSLLHKLREEKDPKFLNRVEKIVWKSFIFGYENSNNIEKEKMIEWMNAALKNKPPVENAPLLCDQLVETLKTSKDRKFFDIVQEKICPIVEKFGFDHRWTLGHGKDDHHAQ